MARQALRSLQTSADSVQLRLELGSVQAGLDQATPCGLLLTELLSNTLKHAFPDGSGGEVCVSLQALPGETGQCQLRVEDDGIGLPADFCLRQQASLGLQLVQNLAAQLNGSLEVGPAAARDATRGALRGASFAITFAVLPPAPLSLSTLPD